MLINIADLRAAFEKYFEREHDIDPSLPTQRVFEFMPSPKKDLKTTHLTLPGCGGIRHSFEWRFKLNDERRRGRLTTGRWPNNHMMTAVDMRRVQLSGTMSLGVHPEIDFAPEAAAPGDGDALLEPPPEDVLERDTKEHSGWRCSYSKLETSLTRQSVF